MFLKGALGQNLGQAGAAPTDVASAAPQVTTAAPAAPTDVASTAPQAPSNILELFKLLFSMSGGGFSPFGGHALAPFGMQTFLRMRRGGFPFSFAPFNPSQVRRNISQTPSLNSALTVSPTRPSTASDVLAPNSGGQRANPAQTFLRGSEAASPFFRGLLRL